jgi:hypothetical protein
MSPQSNDDSLLQSQCGSADAELRDGLTNSALILAAARALTAAGHSEFSRIDVYDWIWERYPRSEHERSSLDPTFQGMVRNAPGGPPSALGQPLERVDRGRYVLADRVVRAASHDDVRTSNRSGF